MTSAQIRQSFLDFFREKRHTIVPSSSLLPDAPNLLFTNAGMNQFVPIFLAQRAADVDKWPGAIPGSPTRAADTQKCIRAGGKHNDLEDVGLDTYHHTFFEMLGNWSFGDYFKKEAIDWAWELLVDRWHFPKERLYATYFQGDEKTPADTEARDLWKRYLPDDHVVPGNRKDNFWMMGDTGPCGPCSEIHMDLTPNGDGGAKLVNAGDARCIEIWNLVFIQFNANPDGSLTALAAKHVDTGMGFERVCSMIQCTNGFQDFTRRISNYETDVFSPIFRELEKLSGKKYTSTLPSDSGAGVSPASVVRGSPDPAQQFGEVGRPSPNQIAVDIAFRVIADHIRCLSFAIADGILPSNEGRGYVLRRILRRAVRYGRNLGFKEPFFYKLVDVVAANFGDVFPELRRSKAKIQSNLKAEEESFNRTLDRGIELFENTTTVLKETESIKVFPGDMAFQLYDTYGFPLDLTELLARERGLPVDVAGFEKLMEEQRQRAREDHDKKKSVVTVATENLQIEPTKFLGYDNLVSEAVVEGVSPGPEQTFDVILDKTPFYAEMGGQVGDTGTVRILGKDGTEIGNLSVLDTQKQGDIFVHRAKLVSGRATEPGEPVWAVVEAQRRSNIQRHHTVTHLFHWALHEVVSRDARQKGSLVAPDRLRFDFNQPEKLSDQQIADIEKLVNERIKENAAVYWFEMPYSEVRGKPNIMQFFGDKYGDIVRIVQIGGHDKALDGFSMELCGGTHTKTTGEIGLFKIMRESAVAAGIRRIEAACGQFAQEFIEKELGQEQAEAEKAKARELEKEQAKQRQSAMQSQAPAIAEQLLSKLQGKLLVGEVPGADANLLRAVIDVVKTKLTSGIAILGGVADGKVSLICYVTPELVKQGKHAGKIVGELAKICGGGGGGKPDLAQAGGKQPEKLAEALVAASRIAGV
ncbi:MAG TPA: alanine--tRNA ligase [Verrucomicrobiae bacterium]|nr:alanine--tRNA ligase [Verrucomicrobiae bacterium]